MPVGLLCETMLSARWPQWLGICRPPEFGVVGRGHRREQHLARRHAEPEAQGAVAVVGIEPVVAGPQQPRRRDQHRLVPRPRDLEEGQVELLEPDLLVVHPPRGEHRAVHGDEVGGGEPAVPRGRCGGRVSSPAAQPSLRFSVAPRVDAGDRVAPDRLVAAVGADRLAARARGRGASAPRAPPPAAPSSMCSTPPSVITVPVGSRRAGVVEADRVAGLLQVHPEVDQVDDAPARGPAAACRRPSGRRPCSGCAVLRHEGRDDGVERAACPAPASSGGRAAGRTGRRGPGGRSRAPGIT